MSEHEEDFEDLLKFLKIGLKYNICYDKKEFENDEWTTIEIRKIVDNEVVVYRTKKFKNYGIGYLTVFKEMYEKDWIEIA